MLSTFPYSDICMRHFHFTLRLTSHTSKSDPQDFLRFDRSAYFSVLVSSTIVLTTVPSRLSGSGFCGSIMYCG